MQKCQTLKCLILVLGSKESTGRMSPCLSLSERLIALVKGLSGVKVMAPDLMRSQSHESEVSECSLEISKEKLTNRLA